MNDYFDFEKSIAEMEAAIEKLKSIAPEKNNYGDEIAELSKKCLQEKIDVYSNLTSWQTVQVSRHPQRPVLQDYIELMCSDFVELHGDRLFGDDKALIGGFATIGKNKVMLIGHNKGKNVNENVERNFGQANPEGYRKALRLMKIAEEYNIPVVCLVDTQGAFPGIEAEARGQAEAIAKNLVEMARLTVPIIVVITGAGGSGGALAIGVGDTILMLSHSVYSVISPEGCAGILWRDNSFAPQAAEAMQMKASSLLELGVIDEIIPEPLGGAHRNHRQTIEEVKNAIVKHIKKLSSLSESKLLSTRFEKYSAIGRFTK